MAEYDEILSAAILEARSRIERRPKLPRLTVDQRSILDDRHRFKVVRAGRRWGKSTLALYTLVDAALKTKNGVFAWIFPIFAQGEKIGARALKEACPSWIFNQSRLRFTCPATGSVIHILSAEAPDSLRGMFLDGCVVDEAALIKQNVFSQVVLPALADHSGWCLFASTPRGVQNWFFAIAHQTGPDWCAWHFSTSDNPYLPAGTVDSLKAIMTEREFAEEILARFEENSGSVFHRIHDAATIESPDLPENHQGHQVVLAVDWGRQHDFTAITAMCVPCHRVVDWDHFNQIDYSIQRERLKVMWGKWNAELVWVESNFGFETTAKSKPPLINGLALAIERHEIDIPKEYVGELQSYEMTVSNTTGRATFSAPEGFYDDRVISLALAEKARQVTTGWGGLA